MSIEYGIFVKTRRPDSDDPNKVWYMKEPVATFTSLVDVGFWFSQTDEERRGNYAVRQREIGAWTTTPGQDDAHAESS